MKKITSFLLAAVAAGAVQQAGALNYAPTHLFLVFRQDATKDVLFDIGSVSNYLALATGTQTPVSYNQNTVVTNFPSGMAGVRFGIIGTTSQVDPLPRIWVSDATVLTTPAQMTFSKFSTISGKLDNVNLNAAIYTLSNAAPYIVSTAASSSYDYLVTGGTLSAVTTFNGDAPTPVGGGLAPLPVDAINPTTIALYQVEVSATNPKPAATLVGAFTLDINGNLRFTAGALPVLPTTRITGIQADPLNSQSATVSFQTAVGANYSLYYATEVAGPWQAVPGAGVANGDGTVQTLTDYGASDPTRFYRIETIY
jgi:hypothetical protein